MKPSSERWSARRLVKYRRRKTTRQCSCRMVPCRRSTKPLVQALARLGARVPNPELATRLIEGAFEFGPTIGQQAADLPAGPLIVRHHDGAQKRGRVGGEMSGQQPGQAVRRSRIAGRNLPHLADALEVADVEG